MKKALLILCGVLCLLAAIKFLPLSDMVIELTQPLLTLFWAIELRYRVIGPALFTTWGISAILGLDVYFNLFMNILVIILFILIILQIIIFCGYVLNELSKMFLEYLKKLTSDCVKKAEDLNSQTQDKIQETELLRFKSCAIEKKLSKRLKYSEKLIRELGQIKTVLFSSYKKTEALLAKYKSSVK